jgi:hypothetical protein
MKSSRLWQTLVRKRKFAHLTTESKDMNGSPTMMGTHFISKTAWRILCFVMRIREVDAQDILETLYIFHGAEAPKELWSGNHSQYRFAGESPASSIVRYYPIRSSSYCFERLD